MPLRQVMTGAWKLLTDEVRRLRFPWEPLRREFVQHDPIRAVDLDLDVLIKNLRIARRERSCGFAIRHDHKVSQALVGECGVQNYLVKRQKQGATRDRVRDQIGTHDGITETRRWSASGRSVFAGWSHAR